MKLSMDVSPEQDAAYDAAVARLGPHFDSLMLTPSKRAILWRLLADLSDLAVETHEIKQIEVMSNIFKTQQMLKSTEEMLKPSSDSINLPTSDSITTPSPKSTSITDKLINYVASVFFTPAIAGLPSANKRMSASERIKNYKPDCVGKQIKGRCVPLMANLKTMHVLGTLDPSMRKLAVRIAKMGDDTNKNPLTLTPAEKNNIAAVAANKAKITTYLIRSDIIREDRARAERIASPNYGKITESFLALLNTVTENVLKSRNMTPKTFLASYGGMAFSKSDANPAKKMLAQENKNILSDKNGREIASDSMAEAEVSAEPQPELPQKTYKIKDINTNKSASLFEIISHRYSTSFASELEDE